MISYRQLFEALEVARSMSKADLAAVVNKPSTRDRGADQRWRKLCERVGVDTSPENVTGDRKTYLRAQYADMRLAQLRERLERQDEEIRQLKTELARLRIEAARG